MKKKTTFTHKKKDKVMEETAFFNSNEKELLFTLYKKLLRLSKDTLQKDKITSYQGDEERRYSKKCIWNESDNKRHADSRHRS